LGQKVPLGTKSLILGGCFLTQTHDFYQKSRLVYIKMLLLFDSRQAAFYKKVIYFNKLSALWRKTHASFDSNPAAF
jgi:hypothetical protein